MSLELRRQKAVSLLKDAGVDAALFCQPENLRYLCSFSGTDGALLVTEDQYVFLTDSRYTTQARNQVYADDIVEYTNKINGITDWVRNNAVDRLGFEASQSYKFISDLKEKGADSWHWLPLDKELQGLRLHKSEEEIRLLSRAAEINSVALQDVEDRIRPGVTEQEIALALEIAIRKAGAEEKSFDYIVASGERGAMPHGVASDRVLQEGELVTIDFGGRLSGYYSDETITLALGEVPDELQKIYDIVLEAHDRAIAAVRPGIPLFDVDKVARDYIKSHGYGEYFGHGLGHGVGLEVHEAPVLSPRSKLKAEEGVVFTIEPGIYLPGVGGVRIEDMIHVTKDGAQVLTKIQKKFRNILLN